jgi:hypothetical protein
VPLKYRGSEKKKINKTSYLLAIEDNKRRKHIIGLTRLQ